MTHEEMVERLTVLYQNCGDAMHYHDRKMKEAATCGNNSNANFHLGSYQAFWTAYDELAEILGKPKGNEE